MNNIIKLLLLSDLFVATGFGLIGPIFAIFVKDNIAGGTIFTAGVASTIYLLVKGITQLPFSRYVDKHDNKVGWLMIGAFLTVLTPILYLFSTNIYHIYAAQVLYGIGSALAFPTWLALWSINLDKKHEGYEWSLYSTATGLGTAGTAAIGGAIAEFIGFAYTLFFVAIISFIGWLILFGLRKKSIKEDGVRSAHYHKHRKLKGETQ
ncbi:MFS transporter [Candidatus Woesearchaeota archaeon]|nr:MFS transporter [Candidatus Woesearchaeota archaeon]